MIHALLWDNDGVLVDTERLFFEANRDFFRRHAIELSEQQFFDWFLAADHGAWHLLRERGAGEAEIDAHREARNALLTERLLGAGNLVVPGMAELLASLAPRVRMGVVTSGGREQFEASHRHGDLVQHLEFVLTAESYARAKPSPEPYLLGLRRLGLSADECLVVEDAPRGLQAAVAAGIRCIVVRNAMTRHHAFDGAYRVVDSVDELRAAIEACL